MQKNVRKHMHTCITLAQHALWCKSLRIHFKSWRKSLTVAKLMLNRLVSWYSCLNFTARGSRETTVDLGVPNNGSYEPGFHRDGHTVDHTGSCGSLYRKQTTAVSRLPCYVARSLKQLLESLSLLAAQQSLPTDIPRAFL